jgi:hypothetical protein
MGGTTVDATGALGERSAPANWRIDRNDPLRKLVNERSHTLRVDMLFGSATDRSAMGQVRKAWREHLGLDDAELRLLARTLGFSEAGDSLDGLRERLDPYFGWLGLRRSPSRAELVPL